ncbi:MAG: isocitrate lyase/PEP mutase family protein [Candidatus Methanosuratincola sp.]
MTKARLLRRLISSPGVMVVPGVYDCIGARLAERVGFPCVFTSGFGISASAFGLPDLGLVTATEMLSSIGRIAEGIAIPLVADIDTGYGGVLNVMRTVGEAVRLGVAGVILEDQEMPKRCGHFEGKRVIPAEEHAAKIRAARDAGGEIVIVARTDARAPLGLDEAIRRGRVYLEAGADVLFIEAPESREELVEVARAFPGVYLFANMVEGGKTPLMDAKELEALGYKIVVFPLSGLFAATSAIRECFENLKRHGGAQGHPGCSFREFEEMIGAHRLREIEKGYGGG